MILAECLGVFANMQAHEALQQQQQQQHACLQCRALSDQLLCSDDTCTCTADHTLTLMIH